ncbi:MAG: SDR family NAD(P)-dependent oxidoreductase, partial [Mycobacterium sp.]
MDLGITGRWALVCASSQGLGRACADALASEGVNVVINGRDEDKLQEAAAAIRALPGAAAVVPVAADITTAEGRAALLATPPACDILVTNNRGPTPGPLPDMTDDLFDEALTLHYRSPMALARAVLPT